jgi:hypothetical protein
MNRDAFLRQARLPISLHRETQQVVSLADSIANPDAIARSGELTVKQKIRLVRARWEAGGWSDIIYGTDGLVDLDMAIREIEAQSDMGKHLLAVAMRAIEMVQEDMAKGGHQ